MSEHDKRYMRRLASSLAEVENERVETPAVADEEHEPPELELHRRAKRLGLVRRSR